ncbi:hypothetical protein [Methyloversatilis discipulorum]|uniref:hypothetical protein n=1 Tax=Methyloversatilis discipulorum TaxID=1119528 RepID=UPI001A5C0DA5|nr:hypothetical protein [Methyloversatilis discipulorum]MBL8469089.1 hypothetical protein [Methyloversatilis discipulorum]
MGVLDDHNRQHTYGDSLGPPTTVVGVSAQQAIDANRRPLDACTQGAPSGRALRGGEHLKLAIGGFIVAAVFVVAVWIVGGFGAVALGLLALIAGVFGVCFLVAALISAAKAKASGARGGGSPPVS